MAKPLFPNVPEDISNVSDADLDAMIEDAEAGIAKVEANDVDGRPHRELLPEVEKGVSDLKRVRAEKERRTAEATAEQEKLATLIEEARVPSDEVEPEDETEDETEIDETTTPEAVEDELPAVAASGEPAKPRGSTGHRLVEAARENNEKLRLGKTRAEHRPMIEGRAPAAITASSDVPGFSTGQALSDGLEIARAMMSKFRNLGASTVEVDVPVVKVSWGDAYPEDRHLAPGMSDSGLMERIRKAVGLAPQGKEQPDAILASGGLCAPVEIRYDLPVLAQADRPVRDSLTNFNATRGGIRFATPPSLAGMTSVGRMTVAQDAAGGTKACHVIACPPFVEVDVAAIYHCLQFGNLGARAFPELVQNATELTMAAQARIAETALLDGMVAASIHATANLTPATNPLGANAILLPALLRASAAMRSRQRMDPEAILDVWMPAWTLDLLTSDLARSAFDRFAQNDADLTRTMESYGLRVTFYWDGPTGASQVFGAQTNNTTLLEFPSAVEIIMAPAGSYLLLDGGMLDLGLVRDSVLNSTNDYQIFAESWENLAFVGLESLHITANVCDTGAVAAAVQVPCGS